MSLVSLYPFVMNSTAVFDRSVHDLESKLARREKSLATIADMASSSSKI